MIDLSAAEIATFHAQGFVALNRITSDDEVGRLREIFDRLFEKRTGWEKGAFLDLAGTDKPARPAVLPQILNPQQFAPELPQTEFRKAALRIAQQLLGLEAHAWFEHAIAKPAEFGAATPWHQDEAHRSDRELDYEQISVWVPLQDAVAENGCMQYIPATHKGPVLTHHSPSDDPRVNALECIGPLDVSRAVACPLPAGGVAIHHCRTIHGAGSNHSRNPRRAYILAFRGSAPKRRCNAVSVAGGKADSRCAAKRSVETTRWPPCHCTSTNSGGLRSIPPPTRWLDSPEGLPLNRGCPASISLQHSEVAHPGLCHCRPYGHG